MSRFITMLTLLSFLSCSTSKHQTENKTSLPAWLSERIAYHESQPVATPPIQIEACLWQGDTVYHESAPCCDQFTILYNQEGQIICSPSGGITGRGDGKCPDFRVNHTVLFTVWKDDRK